MLAARLEREHRAVSSATLRIRFRWMGMLTNHPERDQERWLLHLPDSLHKHARELAARDRVSINQLIAAALAEKRAALLAGEYPAAAPSIRVTRN